MTLHVCKGLATPIMLKKSSLTLKDECAGLMRLRSGVQGHAARCYYCIFTVEIDHQLNCCKAWMFVGNNPDQQMMHAHYNFKAP